MSQQEAPGPAAPLLERVAAIDMGTCQTAAVIGTPRGNLEDPRVEFTALEWGGHSNPNVRPTLFSLQVLSTMAEQWPNAKTFIRKWPRVYRHEVFFSPLPESIKTQQLHFNPFYSVK